MSRDKPMAGGTGTAVPALAVNGCGHSAIDDEVDGDGIASRVVRWQATHGRHSLPWQNTRDPYRVWLSEIMLQQTQVSAVLVYFARFLQRFPDVAALAAAHQDEVLAQWAGLGYYSRARNLHRCAQQVMAVHGGQFPATAEALQTLPGIGRSTAAAIASFCFGERAAILDGNVKRVLTRALGFGADLSVAANERQLWKQASALLPHHDLPTAMPRYTQGLMDLGATVCLVRNPSCLLCPLQDLCIGHRSGEPQRFPVKTRKLKRSSESWWLLWARDASGRIWLERRPDTGVWAGLFCLPVFGSRDAVAPLLQRAGPGANVEDLPAFLHVLTHKDLHLHCVMVDWPGSVAPDAVGQWVERERVAEFGLPTPVRKLLEAG
ncbi:MAG: A/G-specific adenine glycosylase [Rhodoferax sp.]|nr:A/G-specific adenine glycosylase [Rhodoferax sp.]